MTERAASYLNLVGRLSLISVSLAVALKFVDCLWLSFCQGDLVVVSLEISIYLGFVYFIDSNEYLIDHFVFGCYRQCHRNQLTDNPSFQTNYGDVGCTPSVSTPNEKPIAPAQLMIINQDVPAKRRLETLIHDDLYDYARSDDDDEENNWGLSKPEQEPSIFILILRRDQAPETNLPSQFVPGAGSDGAAFKVIGDILYTDSEVNHALFQWRAWSCLINYDESTGFGYFRVVDDDAPEEGQCIELKRDY